MRANLFAALCAGVLAVCLSAGQLRKRATIYRLRLHGGVCCYPAPFVYRPPERGLERAPDERLCSRPLPVETACQAERHRVVRFAEFGRIPATA